MAYRRVVIHLPEDLYQKVALEARASGLGISTLNRMILTYVFARVSLRDVFKAVEIDTLNR